MQKPLQIQKCDGPTDGRTDRHGKVQSRVSATKKTNSTRGESMCQFMSLVKVSYQGWKQTGLFVDEESEGLHGVSEPVHELVKGQLSEVEADKTAQG